MVNQKSVTVKEKNGAEQYTVYWDTNLVVASVHDQYDGTILEGGCQGSRHPPSSRNFLTSRRNVSTTDSV